LRIRCRWEAWIIIADLSKEAGDNLTRKAVFNVTAAVVAVAAM